MYYLGLKLPQRTLLLGFIKNEIKPASQSDFDRENGELQDFLAFCQLGTEVVAVLKDHLVDLGVKKLEDLVDLSEEDIAQEDTGKCYVKVRYTFASLSGSIVLVHVAASVSKWSCCYLC